MWWRQFGVEKLNMYYFFRPVRRVFSDLFESADLTEHCRDIEAICLSKAIGAELQRKYWKEQRTATEPTMESLLKIIDSVSGYAETNVNANLEHDSKPVDLAPLQQAMERALARADSHHRHQSTCLGTRKKWCKSQR